MSREARPKLRSILGGGGGEPPDDGWERATPPDPTETELPEWASELDTSKKGEIQQTVTNAVAIFQRSEEWRGLRFDEFRNEPVCVGAPPVPLIDPPKPGPVDDYAVTHATQWLALRWGIRLSPRTIGADVIEVAAKAKGRAFHPVRDYLKGLEWDGVRRLDTWLHDYAGAPGTSYVGTVGRLWMIAAVSRVMRERSVVKSMLILEGPQNAGKSTLLRLLCPFPDWFSDTPIDLGRAGADKYQVLRGKWIVEIPELDGFRGKDSRSIKSFISSPVDNYRKSFGKKNEDVPRQCVFAGSTNESHYLQDRTGNVRFWPVRIQRARFDEVERDRDQLWAEAVSYYIDGCAWHITDEQTQAAAARETERRQEDDPWMGALITWFQSPYGRALCLAGVTTGQILGMALSLPEERKGRSEETRLGILLRDLGFREIPGRHRPRLYRITSEQIDAMKGDAHGEALATPDD